MRIDQIVKVIQMEETEAPKHLYSTSEDMTDWKITYFYIKGFNTCKEEYDSKEIEFNKEELYEAIRNTELVSDDMAGEIAEALSDPDEWHIHGYGISKDVLGKRLKLIIDDFGNNPVLNDQLKTHQNLLEDYMTKMRQSGIIQMKGTYRPLQMERGD